MYSVLRLGASTSLLRLTCVTLTTLFAVGCGGSSSVGPEPVDLAVDPHSLAEEGACRSTEQLSTSPFVYRCESERGPVFISTFKDCSVSEKFSFQATTRQLFVGVTGLTILSQEPVSFGSRKALQTLVSGTLDAQPLAVSTFTFREGSCVSDVVVWRTEDRPLSAGDSSRAFASLSQSIAEHVLGDDMELGHGEG